MSSKLNRNEIKRFSRQVILKNVGIIGQTKIIQSRVLIIGMGGLGCTVGEFLTRAGIGSLGIVDYDYVDLSNIHRQSLFNSNDLKKAKVYASKKKLNKINSKTNIECHKLKIDKYNIKKIAEKYDYIVDGSDNFKTKFLINDYCVKRKKFLVSGAINKFDGHIFTFNFNKKNTPCLRCFFQEDEITENIFNCEYDGVLGTVANIVGSLQANEVLKQILKTGKNLNGYILILDLLNLDFRKVKLNKRDKCLCKLSLR